jgi:hypothetical protein
MTVPWMAINQYPDPKNSSADVHPDAAWQAVFACQVEIPPFQEWTRLRWGFNNAALLDESLERQRVFLEAQYSYPDEFGMEATDLRTLAFRFIKRPGEEILVSIVGKIHGRTQAEAMDKSSSYLSELMATIPHEYALIPASTQSEFVRVSGNDILDNGIAPLCMAQVKRMEAAPDLKRRAPILQGTWRSLPHAHEPVWRALASSSSPLLLNIVLRSTVLYEAEYDYLFKSTNEEPELDGKQPEPLTLAAWKQWSKQTIQHRLTPWKKHFYLQVHLVSPQRPSEHLLRTIGTSLTINYQSESLNGFDIVSPEPEDAPYWQTKLLDLDIIPSTSYLQHPRLSDVADLDEVMDVMRLPYSLPKTDQQE